MKTIQASIALVVALLLTASAGTGSKSLNVNAPALRGDLDGNGRGDILTRDDAGVLTLLSMNGFSVQSANLILNGGSVGGFEVAATSDLNGDGIEDLVLNYQGLHKVLFMGTNSQTSADLFGDNIAPWHVVAGGDYDGDGNGDLVFQYADQNIYGMALMDGTNVVSGDYLWNGADISPWKIVGGGDFDGDGKADLLIRDTTSSTYGIIFMDGRTMLGAQYVTIGGTTDLSPFEVAAVSDLDGDGKADLVIKNTQDGSQFVLFMDSFNAIAGDYVGGSSTNQPTGTIVGPR